MVQLLIILLFQLIYVIPIKIPDLTTKENISQALKKFSQECDPVKILGKDKICNLGQIYKIPKERYDRHISSGEWTSLTSYFTSLYIDISTGIVFNFEDYIVLVPILFLYSIYCPVIKF